MAKLLKVFGSILIIGVIILCLPVAVPQVMGYGVYDVISGSMEPAIPTGSLVYVQSAAFEEIQVGDVIAFTQGSSVVTHRVVEIDPDSALFTTKGDANTDKDVSPVAYINVHGRVVFSVPFLGFIAAWLTSLSGKLIAAGLVLIGIGMQSVSAQFKDVEPKPDGPFAEGVEIKRHANRTRKRRKYAWIVVLAVIIIVGGVGYCGLYYYNLAASNKLYASLEANYVTDNSQDLSEDNAETQVEWSEMIDVDFDSLQAINPQVVAWIYVENTDISYPILYSGDNDTYLHTAFDGSAARAGSIFMEGANSPDFSDTHTVIYGHNMRNLSMFGSLKYYKADNAYISDGHQYFQIITPTTKYRYEIFSYFDTEADSWVYTLSYADENELSTYISELVRNSYISTDVSVGSQDKIVTLSTCSTTGMRFVVNGVLAETRGIY